jgi:predicted nucleic acid-binding protein
MRVLLDTNILIHREADRVDREDIGTLFRALDSIHAEKCVHPASIEEIARHAVPGVVHAFKVKLDSYHVLKTLAPVTSETAPLGVGDRTDNDRIDTALLREVAAGRVDALITEDRGIHAKARSVGLSASVFTIDSFLEKVNAENPPLADYRVLSVRKTHFGAVNLRDKFFDSFRSEYKDFDKWFNRKADEVAYCCTDVGGDIVAFLFVKREGVEENYSDISPPFGKANRLKIGTFKVTANGYKLGERLLKIVFDNSLLYGVDEIYVTAFGKSTEQERLLGLLGEWGFILHGTKTTLDGVEQVWLRNFRPAFDAANPRRSYPYISTQTRQFIVPIYPAYHTELLPDSILDTESPADFVESKPNRNAISKVYVSRSIERGLRPGDIIVFYRTRSGNGPAHYTSVATTLGIVQEVVEGFHTKDEFIKVCRKRSVFTDAELTAQWDHNPSSRPFIVNFLYAYSLPTRPNLVKLKEAGIITDAPRGIEFMSIESFRKLLEVSNANKRVVID